MNPDGNFDALELSKSLLRKSHALARQKEQGGSFARNWDLVLQDHPELAEGEPTAATASDLNAIVAKYTPALVQCQASFDLDAAPDEIVYLPAGRHQIKPRLNGLAVKAPITVSVDRQTAGRLQADLVKRLSRTVKPFGSFNHRSDGPSAFTPEQFYWDSARGVVLKLAWSRSGRKAVAGADYAHFSPTFLIDQSGQVMGLPETGEIGALTNTPAFELPPIAA